MHRVEVGEWVDVHEQLTSTQRARIVGLCAIRNRARALLDAELKAESDNQIVAT